MFTQFSNQYNFSTILKSSKTAIAQNKSSQRVTMAAGGWSGEGGIRTPGTVTGTQHFQCCTIGHSATSPLPSFAGLPVCSAVRKLVIPQFLLRLTQALAHPRGLPN